MSDGNGAMAVKFTPRQLEVLAILSDGECHAFAEMMSKLGYDPDEQQTLFQHVTNLRRVLRLVGHTIVCETWRNGERGYRHVVLLTSNAARQLLNSVP